MACLKPFLLGGKTPVPCGKCPKCLTRRANDWVFRIMQEEKSACSALFVTLTYDDYGVPVTPNKFLTLSKRHWQLFMKRYRKAHPKGWPSIKYYMCGEYGSTYQRPHYHAIILNGDPQFLQNAWVHDEKSDMAGIMLGEVFLDPRPLTGAAVAYTTGYMNKPRIIPVHSRDDRLKEFSLMSKKLGLSYLTPQMVQYHLTDVSHSSLVLPGGTRSALPRYYYERIYACLSPIVTDTIFRGEVSEPCGNCIACIAKADRLESIVSSQTETFTKKLVNARKLYGDVSIAEAYDILHQDELAYEFNFNRKSLTRKDL